MKHVLGLAAVTVVAALNAQQAPSTPWKRGANLLINFNQTSLSHWAAGGVSSIALLGRFEGFADYSQGVHSWKNDLLLSYGVQKIRGGAPDKSEDIVRFNSVYGRTLSSKWKVGASLGWTTQMTATYKDSELVSRFSAPAFGLASLGFTWTPAPKLEVFLSPATGKITLVTDTALANRGAYGVVPGNTHRFEFGALARATYEREIMKNITWKTRLELFNNYTDPNRPNRKNVDVDWQNSVFMKVNKLISVSLFLHTIYDADIPIDIDDDGDGIPDRQGPRWQWKEVLGIGIGYQWGAKR